MNAKATSSSGFTIIEIVAMLIILGIMTAVVVPRLVALSETAKTKASAAGVAELNGREKIVWQKAIITNDSTVLASDSSIDQAIYDSMDFDLNSGSDDDWAISNLSWTESGGSATLTFKEVDVEIVRTSATLDEPAQWSLSDNASSTGTIDLSDTDESGTWSADGWSVTDEVLSSNGDNGWYLVDDTEFSEGTITVTATLDSGNGYAIVYNATETDSRLPDGYAFQFDPGLGDRFVIRLYEDGSESVIASANMTDIFGDSFDISAEHEITIEVVGTTQTIYVDGVQVLEVDDDTYSSGSVGFRTWSGSEASFEDLTIETD